ncbi:DUF397 domain-containing protein [Streptomyces sp. AJS327]|uniref:DUF397 domain-containing protein n=1 Tax=Streptomyces sp. AJS327 TaxID=2545265 RepID=UPI0015DE7F39|nr:DUF397 domain-containing protein [Streptomyces sp. AJS327]MBA0053196.1 DUF397 domain-containing protein [Streptomyces sp. AJS327]
MTTRASDLLVTWQKSSYSGPNGGDCLEVGHGLAGAVPVRDSKTPQGSALVFEPSAWGTFVATVRRDGSATA